MCENDCGLQSGKLKRKLDECSGTQQEKNINPCFRENFDKKNIRVVKFEPQINDICDKGPKEPYQIPGYAGHVPTLQNRCGGTYGNDTHEVLSSAYGYKPDFSSQNQPNETGTVLNTLRKSHTCPKPLHEPYQIPGYTGHIPGLHSMVGGTYGSDTHKLLYAVQPYPNRQENLSPSPSSSSGSSRRDGLDRPMLAVSGMYQKPDEYYSKPQYKYRIGDTYATKAELTLVDPCINKESKVLLSTRELDDTQVVRSPNTLTEKVQELPFIFRPMRHRPMVPGFDTYVDAMRGAGGQSFEFSDHTPAEKKFQQQLILQKGSIRKPRRNSETQRSEQLQSFSELEVGDGPYGYAKYGAKQKYTNSSICDFTTNYRRRQSTEWAPATINRPDPPSFDIPGEIYSQHTGLLPGYSAHVPGALFRCGKSFTDDSRDARRALRGDRL